MSGCWCKCEAGLGKCGPKVPRLKSLFGANKPTDEASIRRGDRQAELQIIWDEIGEEKSQKLEDLRQMIAAAVDKVYDKALEEGVRRRTALEENVLNSEKRLAEILGPDSARLTALGDVDMEFMLSWLSTQEVLQSAAFAPSQLPLQTRFEMNMARLHELDSERLGAYGWVGGLVVMVELRHRVMLLRETLNLPPCDPLADLDKVLVSTMEDLSSLYPGKSVTLPSCEISGGEQKPVIQRLQKFYQALRAIENTWVETFAQKSYRYNGGFCSRLGGASSDGESLNEHVEKAAHLRLRNIQEKRNVRKRSRDVQRQKSESPVGSGTSNSGSASKSQSSKNKITRPNTPTPEESHSLELLSQNIINKLDTLNQQLKLKIKGTQESPSSSSPSSQAITKSLLDTVRTSEKPGPTGRSTPDLLLQSRDLSPMPLPGKTVRTPTSVRTRAASPSTMILERELLHNPAETPVEVAGLPRAELLPCTARDSPAGLVKMKPADLFGARATIIVPKAVPAKCSPREPLRTLPNCTTGGGGHGLKRPGQPPPPPPPPMPPSGSGLLPMKKQSSKLKRSVKISRLYRNLKTKIEGAAAHVHSIAGVGSSSSRRLSTSGTREGMAEALAEITKKSTYFQKIEDDVQQFRDSIEESKLALDDFETADMEQLLRFYKKLESILENLTDETQVLARFKGFPSHKLETIRLAAALYSRLLCMAQDLEKWEVHAPASEHLEKVTRYFEKIKKDLEVVEGTKEEDLKRFTSQKINFDFTILGRIKEAMVGLSSRCLVQALEESKRSKVADGRDRVYDSNRQKLCSQMLWRAFQLAYRVYNFAGGHDDQSERLISEIASEIDSYPPEVWTS